MSHVPVMADAAVGNWVGPGRGVFLDATFGAGQHSGLGLARMAGDAVLYCADRDPDAVQRAGDLAAKDGRVRPLHAAFSDLEGALDPGHRGQLEAVLMDLGISSLQLDSPGRGFSFLQDGPLDMRMDRSRGITAEAWLRQATRRQMEDAFRDYGGERQARRLATAVAEAREGGGLPATTAELADLIQRSKRGTDGRLHPATRVFLALRVAVNREVEELHQGLRAASRLVRAGGRLVVISFQSLEDRVVKTFFRPVRRELPRNLPLPPDAVRAPPHPWKEVLRAMPGECEKRRNPRSRSAVMRVGEKLG